MSDPIRAAEDRTGKAVVGLSDVDERRRLSYRRRPEGTADQLRERDGANSSRTLAVFLQPVSDRVLRCGNPPAVRQAVREITRRRPSEPRNTSS
jgi:hypothetical protein